MSENRCCCNCRRNIRTKSKDGNVKCNCEIDGHYIGYVECFTGWCRRWASDAKKWKEERMKGAENESANRLLADM